MSAPTFSNSGISYKDSNTTVTGITGNNQYIVQNLSNLVVTLSASGLATANTGTMSAYECTVGNRTIRVAHTASTACTFNFGTVNISRNTSCVIKAIQSNGEYTEASKIILAVPYSPPTVNLVMTRTTPDGNAMTYLVTGSYSPVKIGSTEKNKISKCVRTTKTYLTDGTNSTGTNNYTSGFTTNSGGVFKMSLSLTGVLGRSYDYTGAITDAFGNTATSNTYSISLAIPILSIDSKRGSIGAMCIPEYDSTFQCKMRLDLAKNQYFNSTMKTYGMNAMNSDIIGLNGLFFNDVSNNEGEGLFYPNTGYPVDDIPSRHNWSDTAYNRSQYTQVYWKNKDLYINNEELFCIDDHTVSGWNCYTVNKCGSFRLDIGTFDAGLGDGDGFIIQDTSGQKLQMDSNEIISSKSGSTAYLGVLASQLGLNATQGCRLRYGNDVDVASGNWSGLTLEGGSFSGETFTTNNQVLRLDGNEIICCNNSSKLQELFIRSSNCHISDGTTTLDTLIAQNTTLGVTTTSTLTTDASITAGNIKTYANTIENIKTGSNGWMYLKTNLNSTDGATFILGYDSSNGAFMRHSGTYNKTVTSSSNVYITSGGVFYRSTSSEKAKLDIVPAFDSIEDYKKILRIKPVKWFDKTACEANADAMTAEYNGEDKNIIDVPNLNRVYGCVAEQLSGVGLDCLVDYDNENSEIMGVAYDRIPIMFIPLLKDLYNQVETLQNEIKTLKGES